MSRNFQLQLVRKSLAEWGYTDLSDMLGQRLLAESDEGKNANYTADPILELIQNGDYATLTEALSNFPGEIGREAALQAKNTDANIDTDEFHFGPNLHASLAHLNASERGLALYLVLRTSFLERILLIALETAPSDADQEAFLFLRERVSLAFDAVNRRDENLPFAQKLSKEQEGALLLSLAMTPPSRERLDSVFFTPQVLLVHTKPSLGLSHDDYTCLTRLRNSLVSVLRHAIGIPKPSGPNSPSTVDVHIPDDCLSEIIHKATLYNRSRSLYYLPPRSIHPNHQSKPESIESYTSVDPSVRDDLPIHLLHTLSHHTDEVWYTRFSPSGRFLATGSLDGSCMVFDVTDNFRLLTELDPNAEYEPAAFVKDSYMPPLDKKKGVIYLSWEPHERYLVTCSLDTVIRVWNIESIAPKRRVTRSMNGPDIPVLSACFTLGERMRTWPCEFLKYEKDATPHFIVGSPDKVLKVFSIDGNEVLDFYSDADEWSSILGDTISSTSAARNEAIETSQTRRRSEERSRSPSEELGSNGDSASQFNRINDLAITPNGKVLITANNDKQVFFYKIPNLFDPSTTTSRIASLSLNGRLTSCNISADGRYMLLSIAPEELQLWDISPLESFEKPFLKQKFLGQSQAVYMVRSCFGYLPHSNTREELVLSGSDDGHIYIWKVETGQLITRVKGHEGLCNSVDWNRSYFTKAGRDYGQYWCSVGDDNLVKIWGPRTQQQRST